MSSISIILENKSLKIIKNGVGGGKGEVDEVKRINYVVTFFIITVKFKKRKIAAIVTTNNTNNNSNNNNRFGVFIINQVLIIEHMSPLYVISLSIFTTPFCGRHQKKTISF